VWLISPRLVVGLIVLAKRVMFLLLGGGNPAFLCDTFHSDSVVTTCRRRATSLNRPSLSMLILTPTVALVRACACIVVCPILMRRPVRPGVC